MSNHKRVPILDFGYVQLIESWGSDQMIIESARMSTAKGFLGWGAWKCKRCGFYSNDTNGRQTHTSAPGVFCPTRVEDDMAWEWDPRDEKLLKHLWVNRHATPFEMAGMIVEVKAPIAMFREWHRHRSMGYSEMSARYVPLPNENYIPGARNLVERSEAAAKTRNRQASGTGKIIDEMTARDDLLQMEKLYETIEAAYQQFLNNGWPKEMARFVLPVGRYSAMRATSNLRMWMAFLDLRLAPNVQWELRQFADAVDNLVQQCFPRTWQVMYDGQGFRAIE